MGLVQILLFGIVCITLLSALTAVLILIKDNRKSGKMTGNIITVIEDTDTLPVEIAVTELIYAAEKLEKKGICLNVFLVDRSGNREIEQMLKILSRKYGKIHIIENIHDSTKSCHEILHID